MSETRTDPKTDATAGGPADVDDAASRLSTAPKPVAPRGTLGQLPFGRYLLRWWRQLTSMRTALVLLFLLAVAAVPGSLLPQRSLNPDKVSQYLTDHPQLAPILDRIGGFEVFASPWFAAIYLALVVSLIGCLVPRIRLHTKALRQAPPAAPKHLNRLRRYASVIPDEPLAEDPEKLADSGRDILRKRRWRTVRTVQPDGTVEISAEKGYLRETGNLVFHLAMVALLAGVAVGGLWGWNANVLVTEGSGFCNSPQQYDAYELGRDVEATDLPPFCVELKKFTATYLASGQPSTYSADISYDDGQGGPSRSTRVAVNEPLRLESARLYLIDHGFSPIITYTDRYGQKFSSPNPFIPQDENYSSNGVAIFAEANQRPGATSRESGVEVAFDGVFTPTAPTDGPVVRSVHPAANAPALTIAAYRGDTGLSAGIPRSVYSLDQRQIERGKLKMVGTKSLKPGESWKLDDGGTVTFAGFKEWAGMRVDSNPGQVTVLVAAIFVIAGLLCSLRVRRRRMWIRVSPAADGGKESTVDGAGAPSVEIGGLARTDFEEFESEFTALVDEIRSGVTGTNDVGASAAGVRKEGAVDAR